MARIRTLKPDHGSHRKIGPRSDRAYRVWAAGLVTQADDEGRLPFSLAEIRAKVYAYHQHVTIADVQIALQEILDAKLAILYRTDAGLVIELHDWPEHQRIDRPRPSSYPPPSGHSHLKIVPDSDDSERDRRTFDERSSMDRDRSTGKEGRKEGKEGEERPRAFVEASSNHRRWIDSITGVIGWPPSWEPLQRVIAGNSLLWKHQPWIADLAFWEAQDAYLESPVNLAKMLEGAAAHLVKEDYRPRTKKALRQKIGNLLRMEAKIQRDEAARKR